MSVLGLLRRLDQNLAGLVGGCEKTAATILFLQHNAVERDWLRGSWIAHLAGKRSPGRREGDLQMVAGQISDAIFPVHADVARE